MRLSRSTLIALGLILLGAAVCLGTVIGGWWTWTHFMASGTAITVPCTIDLDLEQPDQNMVLWRELAGSHITANRPLAEPPADQIIEIIDRESGQAIETKEHSWRVRQKVTPGFERDRRAVCVFTPPAHGKITLNVTGSFPHEQVYRVAPSIAERANAILPYWQVGLIGGLLIFLSGVGLLIYKAVRQERAPLRLDDQPFA